MLSRYELYGAKLSLRQKFARLTDRMRDREWRQFFGTIAAAKLLGVALVAFMVLALPGLLRTGTSFFSGRSTYAQESATQTAAAPATAPAATARPVPASAPTAPKA